MARYLSNGSYAFAHVVYRRRVDDVSRVCAAQRVQVVESRLGVAGGKAGELIIADDGHRRCRTCAAQGASLTKGSML